MTLRQQNLMWKLCEAGSRERASRPAGDRILAKMYDFWTPIFFEEKTQRTKTYIAAKYSPIAPAITHQVISAVREAVYSQRTKTYIEAPLSGTMPHSPMRSITLHGGATLSDCASSHSSGAKHHPQSGNDPAYNINPGI
jgi:hypothetical protein